MKFWRPSWPSKQVLYLILRVKRFLNIILPRFKSFKLTSLDKKKIKKKCYLRGLLTLKIRFYFVFFFKNNNHAPNIYIHTHKNYYKLTLESRERNNKSTCTIKSTTLFTTIEFASCNVQIIICHLNQLWIWLCL